MIWSTSIYKYLLFVLATSQLLLVILFWKQASFSGKEDTIKKVKRSNCKCEDELASHTSRFKLDIDKNASENDSHIRLKNDNANEERSGQRPTTRAQKEKEKPVLLVAIISAREYTDRRQAVRETWLQDCHSNDYVICRFFTDALNGVGDPIDAEMSRKLDEESFKNRGDLILLNTPSGTNFALRLLAVFEWANATIQYDFLLRIDDDHFLCLERLLAELPHRPRDRLYWGHVHCHQGIVRIDEGMMILTADLINEFLDEKDKLLCHKYGDQAMAIWIYRTMKRKPVTWFGDARVHHDPPASFLYDFAKRKEICHTFISLHGSYPKEMRQFRELTNKERRSIGTDYVVPPIVDLCPFRRDNFYWNIMTGPYRTMPRPCKDEPIWVSRGVYQGRNSNPFTVAATSKQNVRINRVDLRYFGNGNNSLHNQLNVRN